MLLKAKKTMPKLNAEKVNPKQLRHDYLERMENELKEQGVVLFEPNVNLDIDPEYLRLPRDITDVPSRDLGQLLNAFTQQKLYLRTLYGRVAFAVEEAKREYYDQSHDLYISCTAQKLSETAKERLIGSDEEVKESYYKFMDLTKKLSIIEQSIYNIEDTVFLLSREVTRRTGDFNDENRVHNVGRK